jgi:hypothetical protein
MKPKPKKPPKGHHCFACFSPQINPSAQPVPKVPPKTQGKGTSLPKITKQNHPSLRSSHHRRQHNRATNHAASPCRQHRQTARAPLPSPRSPHNNLPAQQKRRKRRLVVFVGSRKKRKKTKGKLVIFVCEKKKKKKKKDRWQCMIDFHQNEGQLESIRTCGTYIGLDFINGATSTQYWHILEKGLLLCGLMDRQQLEHIFRTLRTRSI